MSAPPARILVVDDNEDNRYTLIQRLSRQGYGATTAACDGHEALAHLAAGDFDLVLLDVMMPGMDGIEVLARIKADARLRHIPVVMISAQSELEYVVRCIELGAEDYLPKPFNPVLLRARVGACLERKRLHDRERAHLAEIDRQRERADHLLHAILPASAVAELKATDTVRPRRFEEVVVVFCDVVGFTGYCDAHSPEEVVRNLDFLVEAFEALTSAHGLEKIKTLGDGLLATAGLLEPSDDPVMAALRCMVALAEAARTGPSGWRLRTGIHVGPVVAGIVGQTKLSYDLWGDTVNVAARLAALGEDGIHLSGAAWRQVEGRCRGQTLGAVAVKGRSPVEVVRYEALLEGASST